jgi:hypothetical protein
MLTDPQVVTVNAIAKSMARILIDGKGKTTYQNSDGTFKLTVSHQHSGKRIRSMARLDQKAIVTDPLTAANDYDTLTFYYVIDRPEYGFSLAQTQQQVAGFNAWLDATMVGKLYGEEA